MHTHDIDHPLFTAYPAVADGQLGNSHFLLGEEVVITEKVDGSHVRLGVIREGSGLIWMVGTKNDRLVNPGENDWGKTPYWFPLANGEIRKLLKSLIAGKRTSVILYGEIPDTEAYDFDDGLDDFVAFDLMLDGVLIDYDLFVKACGAFDVPTVPLIYRGAFSPEVIEELTDGGSLINTAIGREGIVVKPVKARADGNGARIIVKYDVPNLHLLETSDTMDESAPGG